MMEEVGCVDCMKVEGFLYDGIEIFFGDEIFCIDFVEFIGMLVMVYG